MRLKFIICKVLQKEAYFCAARSKNVIDIVMMPQGLHNEPDKLRQEVAAELKNTTDIQDSPYDAILLGYGLCSNGTLGLSADIPIIIPRAHDCVTLLLGSKERYREYFDTHRGVYWYSSGWIENGRQPSKKKFEDTLAEYKQKYGDDNAEYLMEMEQGWMTEYSWATYIDWDLPGSNDEKRFTKECADYMKWDYDELKGDSALMQRFVDGKWNDKDFLRIEPGQKIAEDLTNPGIIKAQPISEDQ